MRPSSPARNSGWSLQNSPLESPPTLLRGGFSGYAEARSVAASGANGRRASVWPWATVFVRQTARIGPARITGAIRLEESSASRVGPLAFDPADRQARRSPVSIRALSVQTPLRSGIDLEVGRFDVGWAGTDGFSPADGFLPRDLTDPLAEERLPLWGARVRIEHKAVRVELLATPTTTPWRLPDLSGQYAPFTSLGVTLDERPWVVPRSGFEAARVEATLGPWDVGAWARAGVRPAPVLVPTLDTAERNTDNLTVPLDRHFARESAVGAQIARGYGGWLLRAELGVSHSHDPGLGDAATWTIGGSRIVGDGTFTATVAGNAVGVPVDPLLLFDRALLPAVILSVRQFEPWGSWRAGWLGTFHTVGGMLTTEVTRDLSDVVKVTIGADLPHGASLSPAEAFAGGTRARAALRWSW